MKTNTIINILEYECVVTRAEQAAIERKLYALSSRLRALRKAERDFTLRIINTRLKSLAPAGSSPSSPSHPSH